MPPAPSPNEQRPYRSNLSTDKPIGAGVALPHGPRRLAVKTS